MDITQQTHWALRANAQRWLQFQARTCNTSICKLIVPDKTMHKIHNYSLILSEKLICK